MMKVRLGVLAAATAVIVGVSYLGWSAPTAHRGGVHQSRSHGHAAEVDHQELQRMIGAYEDRLRTQPNPADFAYLGRLYLQRGRQTGDVQTYLQAEHAVTDALALDPSDPGSNLELASVLYTTHDFSGAVDLAGKMLAVDGSQVGALSVAGDAQLELGIYAGAADAYAKVAASSPDAPAIEVRQARLDFVNGRVDEARRMAAKAEDDAIASALGGPDLAYYETFRGQVELDSGYYDRAATFYGEALQEAPDYYVALAGMGRARAAQGRIDNAISLYEKAVAIVPQPDFLAALGDLYTRKGDTVRARVEYGTVEVIAKLAKINQQVYNRLLALFYADHGLQPDEALRLTQAELAVRKDVYGYDAYAWALYQTGRYAQARDASDKALAQGTADAKILYHSGLIAKAMGDTARARADLSRALAISPSFDPLQASRARAALDHLINTPAPTARSNA
jgi:tetratricopeptide (TPR) repeat protein